MKHIATFAACILLCIALSACIPARTDIHVDIPDNQARHIMEQQVRSSFQYQNYDGHNLHMTFFSRISGDECDAEFRDFMHDTPQYQTCYRAAFVFDINSSKAPALISGYQAEIRMRGDDIDQTSMIELIDVHDFQSCTRAGYEVLQPDCAGCSAYCETPDGVVFWEYPPTG
ncbi:MAG: hypothetical protein ACOCWQ_04525 [Nanoarchaeota archaeon]